MNNLLTLLIWKCVYARIVYIVKKGINIFSKIEKEDTWTNIIEIEYAWSDKIEIEDAWTDKSLVFYKYRTVHRLYPTINQLTIE